MSRGCLVYLCIVAPWSYPSSTGIGKFHDRGKFVPFLPQTSFLAERNAMQTSSRPFPHRFGLSAVVPTEDQVANVEFDGERYNRFCKVQSST